MWWSLRSPSQARSLKWRPMNGFPGLQTGTSLKSSLQHYFPWLRLTMESNSQLTNQGRRLQDCRMEQDRLTAMEDSSWLSSRLQDRTSIIWLWDCGAPAMAVAANAFFASKTTKARWLGNVGEPCETPAGHLMYSIYPWRKSSLHSGFSLVSLSKYSIMWKR